MDVVEFVVRLGIVAVVFIVVGAIMHGTINNFNWREKL